MFTNSLKRYLTILAYVMLVAGIQFWSKFYSDKNTFEASENVADQPVPVVDIIPEENITYKAGKALDTIITSPLDNTEVFDTINLSANISANDTIKDVTFLINDQEVNKFSSSPFTIRYDTRVLPDGDYKFTVLAATDKEQTTNNSYFKIKNSIIDTENPLITFVSPVDRPTVWSGTASLPIEVSALDNRSIKRLEVYINDMLVFPKSGENISGTSNSAKIKINWPSSGVATGDYLLKARAFDSAGNVSQENLRVIRSSYNN